MLGSGGGIANRLVDAADVGWLGFGEMARLQTWLPARIYRWRLRLLYIRWFCQMRELTENPPPASVEFSVNWDRFIARPGFSSDA